MLRARPAEQELRRLVHGDLGIVVGLAVSGSAATHNVDHDLVGDLLPQQTDGQRTVVAAGAQITRGPSLPTPELQATPIVQQPDWRRRDGRGRLIPGRRSPSWRCPGEPVSQRSFEVANEKAVSGHGVEPAPRSTLVVPRASEAHEALGVMH